MREWANGTLWRNALSTLSVALLLLSPASAQPKIDFSAATYLPLERIDRALRTLTKEFPDLAGKSERNYGCAENAEVDEMFACALVSCGRFVVTYQDDAVFNFALIFPREQHEVHCTETHFRRQMLSIATTFIGLDPEKAEAAIELLLSRAPRDTHFRSSPAQERERYREALKRPPRPLEAYEIPISNGWAFASFDYFVEDVPVRSASRFQWRSSTMPKRRRDWNR